MSPLSNLLLLLFLLLRKSGEEKDGSEEAKKGSSGEMSIKIRVGGQFSKEEEEEE